MFDRYEILPIPGFSDPFSSITHLVAAAVFFALGVVLVLRGKGSVNRQIMLGLFVFSVVFLLSMSGVYHLLAPGGTARDILQRMDHAGIFFLIAGSFTPVHGVLFRGWRRWGILSLVWAIAICGIVFKSIYFHEMSEWLGLSIYLLMGWIGALTGLLLYRRYGFQFIKLLIYGALAYTLGAVLEFLRYPIIVPGVVGPHELFHVAVLFGIGYHWAFINKFSDGITPPSKLSHA
ncbi:MAG: hemolysin III family protein [Gammaproteobacteria bacterium]|nr:hemolysin III family protein [Gammaproteobacteria bacterium]MDH5800964.1 hemolysin III family protein [Gammaproteobacteria bacterium]